MHNTGRLLLQPPMPSLNCKNWHAAEARHVAQQRLRLLRALRSICNNNNKTNFNAIVYFINYKMHVPTKVLIKPLSTYNNTGFSN